MRHSVSTQILQDILNYLGTRPAGEVLHLINALQGDAQVVPGTEPPPAEEAPVEATTEEAPQAASEEAAPATEEAAPAPSDEQAS